MFSLESLLSDHCNKIYLNGTHRAASPESTWRVIRPMLADFGITRVANVTGLDYVGVPVYMCCRPNSRSLAVSQGKGIDAISAKVSAVMESIEAWHAEFNQAPLRLENYAELKRHDAVADVDGLPFCKGSLFSMQRPIPWILGRDLLSDEPVWVPFELVHANATIPAVPGSGCFLPSTNGLASGNNLIEAILHGLYEVIERDALTLWELADPDRYSQTRVDCESITPTYCREILARYQAANIIPMVWNTTSDAGLPSFAAIIFDEESDSLLRPMSAAFGSGCHTNRGIAMARALTEAAQSRLTGIAGSRDDMTQGSYRTSQSAEALDYYRQLARETSKALAYNTAPDHEGENFRDDLNNVLDCLRRISIQQVIAVDLSRPGLPISVARVIVPGLEGPTESNWYTPGPRLKERLSWTPISS
jgi:YcaO-like protein with predicted kinase domain